MPGENSLPGYSNVDLGAILEALGTTKFSDPDPAENSLYRGTNWTHVLNGLIIQGGLTYSYSGFNHTVKYNQAFTKQVLGVFLSHRNLATSGYYVGSVGLNSFMVVKETSLLQEFYWLAIGV